jgi:hypothetical protein
MKAKRALAPGGSGGVTGNKDDGVLTIDRIAWRRHDLPMRFEILGEFPALRPSPLGLEFAKSPGCAESMGAAAGASARGSPACGCRMELSIRLKYTGTKLPESGGKSTRSNSCFEIRNNGTSETVGRMYR